MNIQQWLGEDNKLGLDIWNKKYRHNNESFLEFVKRVSLGNSEIETLIIEKKFIPGGRILANIGTNKGANTNCAVLPGHDLDSIEKIMDRCKEMALLFKAGIGLGFNVASIRPKGAITSTGANAPGIIPFMELFSSTTGAIASGGRRGASLLFCDAYHPQAIDFCKSKLDKNNNITNANISLWIDDSFMEAARINTVEERTWYIPDTQENFQYTLDYRAVLDTAIECGILSAEPGFLFKDNYINNSITSGIPELEPTGVNGCVTGNTLILTDKGNVRIDSIIGEPTSIWNGYEWSEVIPKITGYNKEIYLVKFNNGVELHCTDNHKFILKDGSRVTTLQLKEGYEMQKHNYPEINNLENKKIENTQFVQVESVVKTGIIADKVYCVTEPKNNSVVFNGIMTGNCSEFAGTDYATCLLGSMNLAAYVHNKVFNTELYIHDCSVVIRYLNDVLDDGIDKLPMEQMKTVAINERQLGLGIMGLADMFIKMGITYGSETSFETIEKIMFKMSDICLLTSSQLAKEHGTVIDKEKAAHSIFVTNACTLGTETFIAENGLYNTRLLAIAPTGSIATMLGISSGIEPIYKKSYVRRTQSLHGEDVLYSVEHQAIVDYRNENPNSPTDHIVDAHEVKWEDKIALLSSVQFFVDNAISNTLNLPKGTTKEELSGIIFECWTMGIKGLSVYVDGTLDTQILMDKEETKEIKQLSIPEDVVYYKREVVHGCGAINIMIGYSKSKGRIIDVYGIANSNGGCTLNITAQLVYISHILRTSNLQDIERAINGLTACPSYVIGKSTKGIKSGKNCATAILIALREFEKYISGNEDSTHEEVSLLEEGVPCKKCGYPMPQQDGCHACPKCGIVNCS